VRNEAPVAVQYSANSLPEFGRIQITRISIGIRQIEDNHVKVVTGKLGQDLPNIFADESYPRIIIYMWSPTKMSSTQINKLCVDIYPDHARNERGVPAEHLTYRGAFSAANDEYPFSRCVCHGSQCGMYQTFVVYLFIGGGTLKFAVEK
jgi:hypothetical protein